MRESARAGCALPQTRAPATLAVCLLVASVSLLSSCAVALADICGEFEGLDYVQFDVIVSGGEAVDAEMSEIFASPDGFCQIWDMEPGQYGLIECYSESGDELGFEYKAGG